MTRARFRAELDAIYARIPNLICKGLCADACTRIDASDFERQLVRERGVELLGAAIAACLAIWDTRGLADEPEHSPVRNSGSPDVRKSGDPDCRSCKPLSKGAYRATLST